MYKEKMILLGVLLVAFAAASVVPVMASIPAAEVVASTEKNPYAYTPTQQSVSVHAGQITQANLTTEQSTYHWAGVYGNATGTLVLGDSSNKKMYEWPAKANYVFFTTDTQITWDSLTNATCSDIEASGVYDFLSGASDSCENTFTTVANFQPKSISVSITNANAAKTYDGETPQTPYWTTIALKDAGTPSSRDDIVFVGVVDNSGHSAYDGSTFVNYQAILPEDGENGDTSATTYYIWIELY